MILTYKFDVATSKSYQIFMKTLFCVYTSLIPISGRGRFNHFHLHFLRPHTIYILLKTTFLLADD